MSEAYLIVRSSEGRQKIDLNGPVTVGRHRTNVICLEDDRVSRYHCVIEESAGKIKVTDLGSSNGTKVNEQKVKSAELEVGDLVKVGGIQIELVVPGQAPRRSKLGAERRGPDGKPIAVARAGASAGRTAAKSGAEQRAAATTAAAAVAAEDDEDVDQVKFVRKLRGMIDALPDHAVGEKTLIVHNTRGVAMHGPAEEEDPAAKKKKKKKGAKPEEDESQDGIDAIRLLLILCARTGASDIHIEPRPSAFLLRLRVDGIMVEIGEIASVLGERIQGVVKVLCELDIAQRHHMQDGHFSAQADKRHIDYRVSFTPVMHGQKLVVRVLDLALTPKRLEELNLPEWMFSQIKQLMRQNSGMLLNCGPTGSGKTTSLYAAIREVDVNQRNVITIEDPPEYEIPGVTQIPINEKQGNTFSSLLRSILRQDPDVILLGEIRDQETAQIALQAAMTGHLVLSTVHARDTIGCVYRLLDLGAERFLVASALNLVLAQRLVRRLCDNCKTPSRPLPQQQVQMGRAGENLSQIYFPSR